MVDLFTSSPAGTATPYTSEATACRSRSAPPASPLKPKAIVDAAIADMKRWTFKREHRRSDQFAPYAFHRDHVAVASDAEDLIARAIKGRALGLRSGKRETRVIYADAELLDAALAELRA